MARRVFFSFHYDNDINRSMTVRNSWVTQGKEAAGFVDKAEFEKIKRTGKIAVHNWIDSQLNGTSVTVVLIGSDTLNRPFVQYEICESLKRGNGVIDVYIHNIKDMIIQKGSVKGNSDGSPAYFDNVYDGLYDYIEQDGYNNLGSWIETAAKAHNK